MKRGEREKKNTKLLEGKSAFTFVDLVLERGQGTQKQISIQRGVTGVHENQ